MFLAKLPIPIIIYPYATPWIYLLIATVVVGYLVVHLSQGGPIEPTVSIPAGLFLYSSYHMVGGMVNGFDPAFGMGLIGTVASAGFAGFMFSRMAAEQAQLIADEPERQRRMRESGIQTLVQTLGIDEIEAVQLMDKYDNDDTRIIMEARAGKIKVGDGPQEQEISFSAKPVSDGTKIAGSPFDSVNGFALLQASPGEKEYSKWSKQLASVCDLIPLDAMQKMRAHRGAVIITNLKSEVADAFMALLEQDGVRVIKIPIQQMMTFSSGGQVKALEFGESTIRIINHSEQTVDANLESLLLLTVGVFGAESISGPDGMVEARRGHVGADLFVLWENKRCLQFQFDQSRLSYSHLGDRMANNGLANFRLTVGDLIERVPTLKTNDSAVAFAKDGRAKNFKTAEDYGGEVTGLAQLIQATRLLTG